MMPATPDARSCRPARPRLTRPMPPARCPAGIALAALLLGGAAPAAAHEPIVAQPLWVSSMPAAGEAGCGGVFLLDQPAGWQPGDAAAVLLSASADDPLRQSLRTVLFEEGAAVLEIVVASGGDCAIDGAEDSPASLPVNPMADLLGALLAVTRDGGAGLVVVIGEGPGTAIALDAVREDVAARHLGAHPARFAAAGVVGDGPARFVLGPASPPAERAPARFGLLCDARGEAAGAIGSARRPDQADLAGACRASLAPADTSRPITVRREILP